MPNHFTIVAFVFLLTASSTLVSALGATIDPPMKLMGDETLLEELKASPLEPVTELVLLAKRR